MVDNFVIVSLSMSIFSPTFSIFASIRTNKRIETTIGNPTCAIASNISFIATPFLHLYNQLFLCVFYYYKIDKVVEYSKYNRFHPLLKELYDPRLKLFLVPYVYNINTYSYIFFLK